MNIGIIILCRYNSSRLPGKILLEIEGKSILQHIYDRLLKTCPADQIVVATSDLDSDQAIVDYCQAHQIQCFRGSLEDVAGRFLAAAQQYGFDYATRINGDNLFIDLDAMQNMHQIAANGNYDFISNVKGRTFPFGMSIEIVKTSFYTQLYQQLKDPRYREHVTLYLYEHPEAGRIYYHYNESCPEAKGLQMAIDEAKDFEQAREIMRVLKHQDYQYTLKELCQLVPHT
ncbi:MAG: NTP transferase domain-containing protein [Bacteroidota bacterium]